MRETSPKVRAATRLHTDALLRRPNVVAVGAGTRRTKGASTGEPAVVTYVTHKLPAAALRPDERVPDVLVVDDTEVRTDVVEVGEPRFLHVDDATYRPIVGGCQIGTGFGGSGTGGAVMYDRRDQNLVLLTNAHVLTTDANPTTLPVDTRIFQPFGKTRIGQSKRIVQPFPAPLGADFAWYATVDAGITTIDSNLETLFEVVEVGNHPFVVLPPYEGLEVVRRGYRTQRKEGTVEAVDMTVVIKNSAGVRTRIGGPDGVFAIRSGELDVTAMPGDSGSLVVDADGAAARGLVFASNGQMGGVTWACELGTVMSLLELDTPCTGSFNALIRRSVFKRLASPWAVTDYVAGAAGIGSSLVSGYVANVTRFRRDHLGTDAEGTSGKALGAAFHRLGPSLARILATDEDAAGLLERAFGAWLVQPTVFDLLEYRFSEEASANISTAFDRLRQLGADGHALDVVASVFLRANGRSMRELVLDDLREPRRRHGKAV
jgi:hypothetical protein